MMIHAKLRRKEVEGDPSLSSKILRQSHVPPSEVCGPWSAISESSASASYRRFGKCSEELHGHKIEKKLQRGREILSVSKAVGFYSLI